MAKKGKTITAGVSLWDDAAIEHGHHDHTMGNVWTGLSPMHVDALQTLLEAHSEQVMEALKPVFAQIRKELQVMRRKDPRILKGYLDAGVKPDF